MRPFLGFRFLSSLIFRSVRPISANGLPTSSTILMILIVARPQPHGQDGSCRPSRVTDSCPELRMEGIYVLVEPDLKSFDGLGVEFKQLPPVRYRDPGQFIPRASAFILFLAASL